jgi:hypothetical protein
MAPGAGFGRGLDRGVEWLGDEANGLGQAADTATQSRGRGTQLNGCAAMAPGVSVKTTDI